jgi:adenylate cyclase
MSAALAIQQQLKVSLPTPDDRCMRFRIGIHLGDVIGRPRHGMRDSVNIATAPRRLAEPGAITVWDRSGPPSRRGQRQLLVT